jgi:hypothetical protein
MELNFRAYAILGQRFLTVHFSRVDSTPPAPYTWCPMHQILAAIETPPLVTRTLTSGFLSTGLYFSAFMQGCRVRKVRLFPKECLMAKENDIILIHFEDQPLSFARIEEILPDSKPDWYHVKLLMLQVPLQVVTWILRDRYIQGDTFTMNGKRMRLERVVCPETALDEDDRSEDAAAEQPGLSDNKATVISLADKLKR